MTDRAITQGIASRVKLAREIGSNVRTMDHTTHNRMPVLVTNPNPMNKRETR